MGYAQWGSVPQIVRLLIDDFIDYASGESQLHNFR